ncbi:hypothetical protein [Bathymodiolus thermophilus thioautotrophic gill symbiont]|nr:hypothetical protein [Bathymodiolus thermophilus thioautotrophic gill symbiont]
MEILIIDLSLFSNDLESKETHANLYKKLHYFPKGASDFLLCRVLTMQDP